MELKEFISEALISITEGVKDAQEEVKTSGAIINPIMIGEHASKKGELKTKEVFFDIATTVSQENSKGGKVGAKISVLSLGKDVTSISESKEVTRVRFSIEVAFSLMEEKEEIESSVQIV